MYLSRRQNQCARLYAFRLVAATLFVERSTYTRIRNMYPVYTTYTHIHLTVSQEFLASTRQHHQQEAVSATNSYRGKPALPLHLSALARRYRFLVTLLYLSLSLSPLSFPIHRGQFASAVVRGLPFYICVWNPHRVPGRRGMWKWNTTV